MNRQAPTLSDTSIKNDFNVHLLNEETTIGSLKMKTQAFQSRNCQSGESLSKNIGEKKQDEVREAKMRQLLWETSPELKDLKQKFLIADVTKDRAMQMAEKQALQELKRQEELALAELARQEKKRLEADEKMRDMRAHQAKLSYHRDLDELRRFRMTRDTADEDQVEIEKRAIEEIKRKIEEDARRETEERLKKRQELQRQAKELQDIREELRLRERMRDALQDIKSDEFRKAQELRAKELQEKKQLTLQKRLQLQEELLFYLEEIYAEKLKEQLLFTELAVEERIAAEVTKQHEEEAKRLRIREELQSIYEMQMYVKKQNEDAQKKEDEIYKQNLLARLHEEDRLELMSQQKQRLKKLEHMRMAQAVIEDNRRRRETAKASEIAHEKYQKELESERSKMINEEKMKFLKDHARELLGYLPKGIFKDEETIDRLGEEFKKFYFRKSCSS